MRTVLAVVAGAALGAPLRYLVDRAVRRHVGARLPWGTLTVNVVGSAAAGVVAGARPSALAVSFLAVGLLGAFTTASTLAADVLDVSARSRATGAVLMLLHVLPGAAAAALGLVLGRAL
jgi:CrcB protein